MAMRALYGSARLTKDIDFDCENSVSAASMKANMPRRWSTPPVQLDLLILLSCKPRRAIFRTSGDLMVRWQRELA